MTGWLAIGGIVLVLAASVYTGLTHSTTDATAEQPRVIVTPLSDVEPDDVAPAATSAPETNVEGPTATPEQTQNRANCDQIRGTQYVSEEERGWYLANCTRAQGQPAAPSTPTPQPPAPPPPTGPR